jgi:hypothetical protein
MKGKRVHPKDKEIELHPDAWERFERAITVIGKAKPIHRPTKAKRKAKASTRPRSKS